MKILVTGATGNVGREVVKQLIARGIEVKAATRAIDMVNEENVEFVNLDFSQPESIKQALAGVDKVMFITPNVPTAVEMSERFIEHAINAGVKHIVRLSGMGAQMEAITLAKWHRAIERVIEASGIAYTFLRPNSFMQNYVNYFKESIKAQGAFYSPVGEGKVSLVDVRDIAAVAVEALTNTEEHQGKAYDITGGEAISNDEIAEIFASVIGKPVQYVAVSEEAARASMAQNGMPEIMIQAMLELFAVNRANYTAGVSPVVEEVIGKKPVSFHQFANDYAEFFN